MTKAQGSQAAREMNALHKTYAGGRPKKLRECPTCRAELGTRELRAHRCEAAPGRQAAKRE